MEVLNNLSIDFLYQKMLPGMINIDGDLYFINLRRANGRTLVEYVSPSNRLIFKSFAHKYLKEALINAIIGLKEADLVKFFPFGFKSKYELIFDETIIHSRNFDI